MREREGRRENNNRYMMEETKQEDEEEGEEELEYQKNEIGRRRLMHTDWVTKRSIIDDPPSIAPNSWSLSFSGECRPCIRTLAIVLGWRVVHIIQNVLESPAVCIQPNLDR